MGLLDRIRTAGWRAIAERDGALAGAVRKVNDTLGRPLASEEELADRQAFAQGYAGAAKAPAPAAKAKASASATVGPAPVVVYYFKDKQWRDCAKLTDVLDANGVPYKVVNLDGDEATQAAVRRDAKGRGGPLCFIAGECVGGRAELINLAGNGGLKKRVFST